MIKSNKFAPEVRERAVRLVQEPARGYPSLRSAIEPIALEIGCVPQTLLTWVKRREIDAGVREGVTTGEAQRVRTTVRWSFGAHTVEGLLGAPVDGQAIGSARRPIPKFGMIAT